MVKCFFTKMQKAKQIYSFQINHFRFYRYVILYKRYKSHGRGTIGNSNSVNGNILTSKRNASSKMLHILVYKYRVCAEEGFFLVLVSISRY